MGRRFVLLAAGSLLVAACSTSAGPPAPGWTFPAETPVPPGATALVVEVYKSPACACCHEWEAYLRDRGYTVRSVPTDDMASVKVRYGLPEATWSCHTAVVDGYAIEGHVPVEAVEHLLTERPEIDAIALPAMPPGSPGMPGVKEGLFEILAVSDGAVSTFGRY